jgi:hypothetical protein
LLKCPVVVRWFNPRTGEWAEAGEVTDRWHRFTTPDEGDWLLCLQGKP